MRFHRHHCAVVIAIGLTAILPGCDAPSTPRPSAAFGPGHSLGIVYDDASGMTYVDFDELSVDELRAFVALDDAQRARVMQVFVGKDEDDALPPITGTTTPVGRMLRFTPRYPLAAGLDYRVRVDRAILNEDVDGMPVWTSTFSVPRPPAATTTITYVYPTSDQLPENHLKFYIHFSAPMSRGEAYEHVHLLDANGHELPAVFLELGEELWDPAMQRFTLLFDPGRVKRGLVPREELGAVLTAGRDYTLVIDGDWHDAHGQPLARGLRKPFHVTVADETPIDVKTWKLVAPPAASRDPLAVTFPEPLDHALLERVLHVTTANGEPIPGQIDVGEAETRWRFTPERPWSAGDYQLVVETTLEDLAGNAIGRAFDVDLFGPVTERIETDTVSLPFTVAAP
jgi:hypothetical protein